MVVARMLFDNGDAAGAKARLLWVIEKSGEDNLRQIARYRLAEIQFDAKEYDDALRTLDAKHDDAFVGLYADLRGDILAAAGRPADARTAYQTAVGKLDPKGAYHTYVQVKLDGLGGPLTPAGGTVTGTAPAAPAATAAPAAAKGAAQPAKTTPLAVTPAPPAAAPAPLTVAPAK
jgi:tetratricopeptide (TPR) repeat protein